MGTRRRRVVARSEEDLAQKRDLILDAAMRMLLEKGFARSTMSDVAQVADIGRGTVYWHFPSKNGLFLAAVQREVDRAAERQHQPDLDQEQAGVLLRGLARDPGQRYARAGDFTAARYPQLIGNTTYQAIAFHA